MLDSIESDENRELDEQQIETLNHKDSVIDKLSEQQVKSDLVPTYYTECVELIDFLKKTQELMLENAVFLEKLIENENKKREQKIQNDYFNHLIKVGLCLFWVYFLLFNIIVSINSKN